MKNKSYIIIKVECIIILLLLANVLSGQVDPAKVSPPGEELQKKQETVQQADPENNDISDSQLQQKDQEQDKAKQKKDAESKKDVKEVKSSSPDMKKAKGARPPYINRPTGTARPQGAGKPAGAVKPGRR